MNFWLHFVGKQYYSIESFVEEARTVGVSRRLPLKTLEKMSVGDVVLLAQWDGKKAVLFGGFEVHGVSGIPGDVTKKLVEKLPVKHVEMFEEPVKVEKGCGEYYVTQIVSFETLDFQVVVKEVEDYDAKVPIMVEGSYFDLGDKFPEFKGQDFIYSSINHSQGFRMINFGQFMAAYEAEVKKIETLTRKRVPKVNGYFYVDARRTDEYTETHTPATELKRVVEVKNYSKR